MGGGGGGRRREHSYGEVLLKIEVVVGSQLGHKEEGLVDRVEEREEQR